MLGVRRDDKGMDADVTNGERGGNAMVRSGLGVSKQ